MKPRELILLAKADDVNRVRFRSPLAPLFRFTGWKRVGNCLQTRTTSPVTGGARKTVRGLSILTLQHAEHTKQKTIGGHIGAGATWISDTWRRPLTIRDSLG